MKRGWRHDGSCSLSRNVHKALAFIAAACVFTSLAVGAKRAASSMAQSSYSAAKIIVTDGEGASQCVSSSTIPSTTESVPLIIAARRMPAKSAKGAAMSMPCAPVLPIAAPHLTTTATSMRPPQIREPLAISRRGGDKTAAGHDLGRQTMLGQMHGKMQAGDAACLALQPAC